MGCKFTDFFFRSNYIEAVPSQPIKKERIITGSPFCKDKTELIRNENNNSSYRPAPPPRKKEFSIVCSITPMFYFLNFIFLVPSTLSIGSFVCPTKARTGRIWKFPESKFSGSKIRNNPLATAG